MNSLTQFDPLDLISQDDRLKLTSDQETQLRKKMQQKFEEYLIIKLADELNQEQLEQVLDSINFEQRLNIFKKHITDVDQKIETILEEYKKPYEGSNKVMKEDRERSGAGEGFALMQKLLNAGDSLRNQALAVAKHSERLTEVFAHTIAKIDRRVTLPAAFAVAAAAGLLLSNNLETSQNTPTYSNSDMPTPRPTSTFATAEDLAAASPKIPTEEEIKAQREKIVEENRTFTSFQKILTSTIKDWNVIDENSQLMQSLKQENLDIDEIGKEGTGYSYFIDGKKPDKKEHPDILMIHDLDDDGKGGMYRTRMKLNGNDQIVRNDQVVNLTEQEVRARTDKLYSNVSADEWKVMNEGARVLEREGAFLGMRLKSVVKVHPNGIVEQSVTMKREGQPNPFNPRDIIPDEKDKDDPTNMI